MNNPKKCVGDYFNTQDNKTTDTTITFIVSYSKEKNMLAGTYYFYKDGNLIKEIDIEDLPDMDKHTFEQYTLNLGADKAVLRGVYHGGQMDESEEVLYDNTQQKNAKK